MSTALVLADAGKRENGRWKRNALTSISEDSRLSSAWKKSLEQAGQVLDHAPDLANAVVNADMALDAAFKEAEKRRDAERQLLADPGLARVSPAPDDSTGPGLTLGESQSR